MKLRGSEIVEASGGRLLQGSPEQYVSGFAIDSRQVKQGDLFIPFRGEQTDGHLYITKAAESGAAGAFHELNVKRECSIPENFLLIGVEDSLLALQKLASAYRSRFKLPVIGITGSSGKTTTKDFTAGVLSAKYNILKTTGNLNNEIGLPLTILKLKNEHEVAVLEMGMSAPGEITTLCEIADPTIGVITNIGEAHIELLGSMEAIANAKGELLDYLGSGGVAVLNGDDPRLLKIGRRFPGKVLYYGFNQGDIKGFSLSQRGEKCFFRVRFPDKSEGLFESPLPGRESASNALAALTVGYILGLSLQQMQEGLQKSEATAGRLQVFHNNDGLGVIDDTYNANPDSVRAALKVLTDLGGPNTVAVLGDMLELGFAAREAHSSIGRFAADCFIKYLVTVGRLAALAADEAAKAGISVFKCKDHDQALLALRGLPLDKDWYVLVKGSRGMQMEKIVQKLMEAREVGK
ncbi:MAG: UDP-N-acetylmuramoyl-tripeptide--D-alanyl-D-alanine ligase [Dethiobacteria bacterium]|nr:UDP-N-acetylmuramoyl-tripeptide--D-alanyl-D-alanine ligase [Bacillota bacterium]MDW7728566.1 UDP-N-acetylmuramoyl-tripeptide--D-alanyl-D-alanine ligase [Bacillota bacterium]